MPRNSGTGVYTPPPNTTAIPNAVITSTMWNAFRSDIVSTFNAPVPVGMGGTGSSSISGILAAIGGLPLSGGTMTGALTLSGDATANFHPVTKQQLEASLLTKADLAHTQLAATISDFSSGVFSALGASSISAFSDVMVTSPIAGQFLTWNGTNFVNSNLSATEYNKGTLAAGTTYTQSHGLGARPIVFDVYLECTTAELGYSIGDRIYANFSTSLSNYGAVHGNTTTNCFYVTRDSFEVDIPNKSTGLASTITKTRWNVIFVIR